MACLMFTVLGLALVAMAFSRHTAGSRLSLEDQHQQGYAFRGLQQSMGQQVLASSTTRHLVYTSVGSDPDYVRLLKWLLLSLSHTSKQPNYEFLVILDLASKAVVEGIVRSQQLRFKVDFMVLDPAEVDKPFEAPFVAASTRKLDIHQYHRLSEFTNLLCIDVDHLVTVDVSDILSTDLQPGILYAHEEQRIMQITPPEELVELFQQPWWGFKNYTDEEIDLFRQHHVVPFSAGCYMFKNTPEMMQVMRNVKDTYLAFNGTNYFYEQSFLNYYFNTRLLANLSLLSRYSLEYWTVLNAAGTYTWSNKLIHFTQTGYAQQREALMEHYYHIEVVGRRHAKMAVLSSWLRTVSAYALESLPEEEREGWFAGMGHIGQVPRQVERYYTLASKPGVQTICEIGFNAGHSAAVYMAANPLATMYMFDLMTLPYSKRSKAMFKSLLPETFHFIKGSSFQTLPLLHEAHPEIKCDLFSVDGDHTYEGALTDFLNAHAMMPIGAIMVADDLTSRFSGCHQAWEEMILAGYLKGVDCERPQEYDSNVPGTGIKRWCWGIASVPGRQLAVPIASRRQPFHLNTAP